MDFLPILRIGWLNGWLPLAIFYTFFGLFLLTCKKSIVKKLYSVAGWSKREYVLSGIRKPFSLAIIALMIFTPLRIFLLNFWIGLFIYGAGFIVMFVALFEFKRIPEKEVAATGIYRYTRNPQWVGLVLILFGTCLMAGNGAALVLFTGSLSLYHFRILGEERACLAAYGKQYQKYLDSVPRYF